ncbi:OmpA family protein [Pedobacter insulae]|uniref:WD40-like Beta Propeller Repeat n=1 Tax=Pedobacter insulae TaxID=414048 RepID=A0A1I3ADN4_9SPHI|nr:OmpA family protein [Pedobacter insulae]SFH48065.1 WD40-like Beta Propeller Repeat [Pedobacter insulae]
MKSIRIILILCLAAIFSQAQTVTNHKKAADVYFINQEYYAAAKFYQKALEISQDSAFVIPYGFQTRFSPDVAGKEDAEYATFQLANSLRLYRNYKDAEKWYAIATKFTDAKYVLSGYWYGESLRANLKYDEAITAFTNFIAKYNGTDDYKLRARKEIESCRYALQEMKYPRLFGLAKLSKEVNGLGSNYAPFLNNQNLYFTSSRPIETSGKTELLKAEGIKATVSKKETPFVNTIYSTIGNLNQTTVTVEKVLGVKNLEAGATAIHPNGEVMFLTVWSTKPDRKRGIHMSRKINNQWSEPVMLGAEVNVTGFNAMQPFVTNDGKYLIFSSDRPGGSGKYDLWYAAIGTDFKVENAINMGSKINTKEDEQAPYYNPSTKRLLFSSNGNVGIGGFDFYESMGSLANMTKAENLGFPFNSAKDDMYFTPVGSNDNEGYISSDRESLCCLEIYHVVRTWLTIKGRLIDCETLKPLDGATVTLTGKDFETQKVVTDVNGRYNFKVNSNRGFQLNAAKDSYFAKNMTVTLDQLVKIDTLFNPDLCLTPFKIDKPIVLENILYEFDKATLTDASKVILDNLYGIMVDNQNIEIELSAHTDILGGYDYNIDLSERRAKSCVDYLVSKGIAAERMRSKGYGYNIPVAPNKTPDGKDNPEGRALNRRTEFKVTKK